MSVYGIGIMLLILMGFKMGFPLAVTLIGIWGIVCSVVKKVRFSIASRCTEPRCGENKKRFFCAKVMADNTIKAAYNDAECIADSVSIQPMSSNFFPPTENITLSSGISAEINGIEVPIEEVKKITGDKIYSLPTRLDSEEGKRFGLFKVRNIKRYMVIEEIVKNKEKVLINGYINSKGNICADEIITIQKNIENRFVSSKAFVNGHLFLITFGIFLILVF